MKKEVSNKESQHNVQKSKTVLGTGEGFHEYTFEKHWLGPFLHQPERTSRLSCREEKLPCPLLWQNPRCVASWPNICDFILLEHSWSPWGLQLSISLLWLKKERRHMQTSTEIMIPWKILRRWGRLVSFRVQSDLEYKESLWVEFLGSLSLCCAPELWNYDYPGWEMVSQ